MCPKEAASPVTASGPFLMASHISLHSMTASTPETAVKPMMVRTRLKTPSSEVARKVGSTPSMIQGCRPNSATNQPSSAASQGSGKAQSASRNSQRGASASRIVYQSEVKNTASSAKPNNTMKRKVKKMDGTPGTVDQAASWICSGVACNGFSM